MKTAEDFTFNELMMKAADEFIEFKKRNAKYGTLGMKVMLYQMLSVMEKIHSNHADMAKIERTLKD